MDVNYLQLIPETRLPDISGFKPFLAVLVIEEQVEPGWRETVSKWLVKSGCLYMMAWGINCGDWDDSVDMANIQQFNYGEIPEDELVVTTWHEDDPLNEVFWQAKNIASHSCVEMSHTLILHISDKNKQEEYISLYEKS
jgi:hypothetical protein